MQELGSTKSSSENISLSEGLLCQFSQSTEYLIPDFCPELLSVKGQWLQWVVTDSILVELNVQCNRHVIYYVLVAQSWPTFYDPMDCSPPGCSVHGILQAGILEWIFIPFSSGSSLPRYWTRVSRIAGRFFTIWATRDELTAYDLHAFFCLLALHL